ncbi:YjgN family protein [Marinobacter caseinilyticus]|uniref:YjgN family protein n=1 Tax=Marinobacter caseinilyticus TaxID=2692195 RepID=UPI0014099285|nr:YjgN family protein [Marinobacter caseinilyticus]
MTTELYQITFNGGILDGFEPADVRRDIQALFRISDERLERLFDSSTSIIKSGVSLQEALRYQERLISSGADVTMSALAAQSQAMAPQAAESEPSTSGNLSLEQSATPEATGATNSPKTPAASSERGLLRQAPLTFNGRGGEYFGIWIVNILLTIVTLGIYSAWATVRNKQYFYGNTELDGSSFQYLASPITILKGRLIALAVLVIFTMISEFYAKAGLALAIGFIFIVPWIVIRSLRFNAINSAYRNVRFNFQASYGHALMVVFVWPLLNLLTLLILVPFSALKSHQFIANGSRYGTTPFQLNNTVGEYYRFFGKGLLIGLGFGVIAGVLGYFVHQVAGMAVTFAAYLVLFGYFSAGITNLFMNGTTLDNHQFESNLEGTRMVWIYVSNSVLVALTLGLYTPWAKVRMVQYRASRTALTVDGDLDHFVAAEAERTSALGQELGDAFDVEFAAI